MGKKEFGCSKFESHIWDNAKDINTTSPPHYHSHSSLSLSLSLSKYIYIYIYIYILLSNVYSNYIIKMYSLIYICLSLKAQLL